MNRIVMAICFCALFVLFESCKKENIPNAVVPDSISGSWELRQTSGGMMVGSNNYSPGNGNILKFTGSVYETYIDGQFVKSGPYTIIADATVEESVCLIVPSGEYNSRIIYDSSYGTTKVFLQVSNNKLKFLSGCYAYDAGQYSEYERLNHER